MGEVREVRLPDGLAAGATGVRASRSKSSAGNGRSAGRARLAALAMDQLPLAVVVLDRTLRLHYWNLQAAELFAIPGLLWDDPPPLAEVLQAADRVTPNQLNRIIAFCGNIISGVDRAEPHDWLRITLSRQHRLAFKLHPIADDRWLLGIEDLVQATQVASTPDGSSLDGSAMVDALTGLSNRRSFNETLRKVLRDRDPATQPAVLMIDLDRFKHVNDTLGHPVGDALLCLVAQRLQRETREDDLVARLGGDQFVVLLPTTERAEPLALRLVDVLSRPFLVEGHVVNIGASVGLVCHGAPDTSAEDLLRHAELALYQAKSCGGLACRMFDPVMAKVARDRRELETDLRKALLLGELSLAYQPQFNVRDQRLTGFEALLRWTHPIHGAIAPSIFIPIAEEIGCMPSLGEWVLQTACQEAARWPDHLSIAVNVSPRQFGDTERLLKTVQSALTASGLSPARLEIEITESAIMVQEASTLDLLHRLRGLGIRIAMDDFGIGYSSLSQLLSFPFDKIKIDKSFVSSLRSSTEAAVVIRAITALGAGLGMSTIAEGVETDEQAVLVAADGCTDIQGFLISRPVAAAEVDALVARYSPPPPTRRAEKAGPNKMSRTG